MPETVLLTGASGFVGRHLAERCLSLAHETLALTRPGRAQAAPAGIRAITVDFSDEMSLARAIEAARPTVIIHLAAYGVAPQDRDPVAMQRINVDLGAAIVRAAAACGAVMVSAGSCAEYAEPADDKRLGENAPLETGKLYGSSKAAGGLLALATATALGVPMRHLRLFNVYGPGEAPHRLLPSLIAERASDRRIRLSAGLQIRDFIYVADVADGLLNAATRLRSGAIAGAAALNLCTGTGTSVRDLVGLAAQALGITTDRLGFGDLAMRPDEIPCLIGNPDKMTFDLDWRPAYGPAAGIKAMIEGL